MKPRDYNVIEYFVTDRRRVFSPIVFFVAGAFYTVLSAVVALVLFPNHASVAFILLTTVAVAPILFRAITLAAELIDEYPHLVLIAQSWLFILYLSYMLGALLGFQLSYIIVPSSERYALMKEQIHELQLIEGVKAELSGMATKEAAFWTILTNNLRVYIISILLSFLYGTGGMLLLNWNASIIATLFYEKMTRSPLLAAGTALSILPHSLLEFLGYFTGGITGILIGVAIIQEGWNRRLLRDVVLYFLLGIGFILLGAMLESGFI